jgi:hypothetical protein
MTLNDFLQQENITLEIRHKGVLGSRLRDKYVADGYTPERVKIKERGLELNVIDYDQEWLENNVDIIINYLQELIS